MTPDEYIVAVIKRYEVDYSATSPVMVAVKAVYPILNVWAGSYHESIKFSGSHAKGTAIKGKSDTDLFISLKPVTNTNLKLVYESLDKKLKSSGYQTRLQNVSIGINHRGVMMDIVPGVKLQGYTDDHWLYVKKSGYEKTKTNVKTHIDKVKDSNRINEIKAVKIWTKNHNLDFPSFYLELTVINALSGYKIGNLANNFSIALSYIADYLPSTRVIDPSNSANIISNDLTDEEKRVLAAQAKSSLSEPKWEKTLWYE